MEETLAKLDRVKVFHVVRILADGMKDACASTSGAVTFFADAADAEAAFEELRRGDPEARLRLELVPLGRAFALTQGLMGLRAPMTSRLQFSQSVVEAEGEAGVTPVHRERMRGAGPFPLFYAEGVGSVGVITPVFFSRADLATQWSTQNAKAGRPEAPLPPVTVTDLRVVVARTLEEPGDWKPLVYVPLGGSSAQLARQLTARADSEAAIASGFVRGANTLAKVAHEVALADGDLPPPLTSGLET